MIGMSEAAYVFEARHVGMDGYEDTLPQDFAETVPTAILLTEEEAAEVLGPHYEG
jgi:hypothetical protein